MSGAKADEPNPPIVAANIVVDVKDVARLGRSVPLPGVRSALGAPLTLQPTRSAGSLVQRPRFALVNAAAQTASSPQTVRRRSDTALAP